uniref:Uncharacterized protein n=1 Tax=Rhipicephalus zambeziensis TaxID=60191 RepID=A0A224YLW1_9ACAR
MPTTHQHSLPCHVTLTSFYYLVFFIFLALTSSLFISFLLFLSLSVVLSPMRVIASQASQIGTRVLGVKQKMKRATRALPVPDYDSFLSALHDITKSLATPL